MQRLRRLLALALLVLWLPATLHCHLEAAGLDALFHCAADSACCASTGTPQDACDLVETGAFKPAADSAVLPPPTLCACLLSLVVPRPALTFTPPSCDLTERHAAPPEVARTWRFVVRAAPPSRAPSLA